MKICYAAMVLAALAACGVARADGISVTGAVSYTDYVDGSGVCSSSGYSTSLALACGDSKGKSTLTANLGNTSGSAQIEEETAQLGSIPTSANASLNVLIDSTYMLTGGTGYGYATVTLDGDTFGPSFTCSTIDLGGVSDPCNWQSLPAYGSWALSDTFYVPYNTPLDLSMDLNFSMASYGSGGGGGEFSYSLSDDLVPVSAPEPSAFLLLGSGLLFLLPVKFWTHARKR